MSVGRINSLFTLRPAVPAAVLLIVGIIAHAWLPNEPLAWLIASALLIGAASFSLRHGMICSALIGLAILSTGIASGQLASSWFPRNHIGAFVGAEPRLGWVEARIRETPRTIESPPRGRKLPDKQLFIADVRAVRTWDGWASAEGEVPVTLCPPREDLAPGQTVRILGRLERPQPAMNPGGFDSAAHYRRQRILVTMHVSRPYDIEIVSNASAPAAPLACLRSVSRRTLDAGFEPSRTEDRALLRALVFGDREPALREIDDDFRTTGTAHVLAANGTRVFIVTAMVYLLCRLLRLPPRRTLATVTLFIALFGFLTLPAAQAVRPVIVCIAVGLGLLGRRAADSIQLLALAAIAVLVLRPLDLYGPGFQLSFVIVLGMILFTRPLVNWIDARLQNSDERIAKSMRRQTVWQRRRERLRHWIIEALAAATVAWVVAVPLVACHFEQFNLWTVPFSIVLSPLATAAMACGFIKIVLTAACPPLAGLWAALAWPAPAVLRHVVRWLAATPGADLPIATPQVWQIVLFYALLALARIPWSRRAVRWCARCAPAGACAMILILPWCGGMAAPNSSSPGVRITLLSVGAGQCAVIEPSGGGTLLIDAGSSAASDVLRTTIAPYLRHEECLAIDTVWLSHGDYDHISAARQIVPRYRVREVMTSPHFRRHAPESAPCAALLSMLDRTHHSPHTVIQGDRMRIGNGVEIEVLWPPAHCDFNSNNTGLVLRLTCAGHSILFPADIQEPAERELLKHPEKLRSDILVAPHHGSAEPTTADFIRAVNPEIILSSNAERLTKKQRLFDVETQSLLLYRTSRCGAITIDISKNGAVNVVPFHAGKVLSFRRD